MKIYDPICTCNKIFEITAKRHLTDSNLAKMIGITPQAISKWRRGSGYPSLDVLVILSGILDVSMDELLQYRMIDIRREEY